LKAEEKKKDKAERTLVRVLNNEEKWAKDRMEETRDENRELGKLQNRLDYDDIAETESTLEQLSKLNLN
jgi:hypothetical protein